MKISKTNRSNKVMATVSKKDMDEEFENFGTDTLEDDFPKSDSDTPITKYLQLFNRAIDDIQSAIQALVKSSSIAVDVSEKAQRAAKEGVKDLAVVLAELQLAKTEAEPKN